MINLTWTPALKNSYANAVLSAMKNTEVNPQFPRAIYADIDVAGTVTGFDTIAAVHANSLDESQYVIDSQFDASAMGEWGDLENETILFDLVDCLESTDTYRTISEGIDEYNEENG